MNRLNPFIQPKSFYPIFLIEVCWRLAYYGIQILLATYVAKQLQLNANDTLVLVGTFVILMYGFVYIGGYLADTILTMRHTILLGLLALFIGYSLLGLQNSNYFYLALSCIIAGNALFQANTTALLTKAYAINDQYLDGAFTLYHTALNVGVFLVPLFLPKLVEIMGWQSSVLWLALAIATASLTLGWAWRQFKQLESLSTTKHLTFRSGFIVMLVLFSLISMSMWALQEAIVFYVIFALIIINTIIILIKRYLILDYQERSKLTVVLILLASIALFFTVYWKMSEPLNFFAIQHVQSTVFGFELGTLMFFKLNPLFILLLAPLLAWFYNYLARQNKDWSIPSKFTAGMFIYALGFFILSLAAPFADAQGVISASWLLISYLLQALAELLTTALALAMVARLVPRNIVGFMMGLRHLMVGSGIFVGSYLLEPTNIPEFVDQDALASLSEYTLLFTKAGVVVLVFALLMLLLLPRMQRMIQGGITNPPTLTVASLGYSLGNKLSKKLSIYIYSLLIGLALFLFITVYLSARYFYNQQTTSVITSVQDNLQQALIIDDRTAIAEQLEFLSETDLFSRIVVLDAHKNILTQFPEADQLMEKTVPVVSSFLIFVGGDRSPGTSDLIYQPLMDFDGNLIAYYAYQTNFNQFFMVFLWWSVIFLLFLGLAAILFIKILKKSFYAEFDKFSLFLVQLEKLTENIEQTGLKPVTVSMSPGYSEEQEKINEIITALMSKIQQSQEEIKKITHIAEAQKLKAKLSEVALQVSHDIRSPLSSLQAVLHELTDVPEETRIHIRNIVNRLKEIVNNLLAQHKHTMQQEAVEDKHIVLALIESLVAEKKIQYKSKKIHWLQPQFDDNGVYSLFVLFNAVDFKRMLSNLIDNAVEACEGTGTIRIKFTADTDVVTISLQDDGKGIPKSNMSKVFQEGFTFGKPNGSGLGLYQAKQAINKRRGTLEIHSVENKGTTIVVTLPRVQPPNWFVQKLVLHTGMQIVILDDDKSIHDIWYRKFKPFADHITVLNFYCPEELMQWHAEHHDKNTLYLCDYEFIGRSDTGVDVIKTLHIAKQSFLVTSRFEEYKIRKACDVLGVKLIPKSISGFLNVKMRHDFTTIKQAILIDDDPMIHKTWELSTALKDIKLHHFSSYADARKVLHTFDSSIVIFVDSNLSDNIKGEEVSKELPKLGYENIYLITGAVKDKFFHYKHIIDVLDKYPPWNIDHE